MTYKTGHKMIMDFQYWTEDRPSTPLRFAQDGGPEVLSLRANEESAAIPC